MVFVLIILEDVDNGEGDKECVSGWNKVLILSLCVVSQHAGFV